MDADFDLVIRGGTIVDGSGAAPFEADIAVKGTKIAKIGRVDGRGAEEIDARDRLVTPGFVDIHTHYDGQVTWDQYTQPSAAHGVTTVVMGNCGLGFAPCKPADRDRLINLMVGVEDIPEAVMAEGIPWNWETFEEYLQAVDARRRDVDVAAQLPHSALRVYVMGERAADGQIATEDDLQKMSKIAEEAMRAGAIGFATSRSIYHNDPQGEPIPTKNAAEAELLAIAMGVKAAGSGVLETLIDFDDIDNDFAMLRRLVEKSGRPLSFSLFQTPLFPKAWRRALQLVDQANADGLPIRAQVLGRPTGFLLGLNLSFNPFSYHPSYQAIEHLPFAERVKVMQDPAVRARILSEEHSDPPNPGIAMMYAFDRLYALGKTPNYEPDPSTSVAAMASTRGLDPWSIIYDMLLEDDGNAVLFTMLANYVDGNLDTVMAMLQHEYTMLGLGDGGAHCGLLCDAGYPTFMLTYWARDRGEKGSLSVPEVIRSLTSEPAQAVGLNDRGLLREGMKADINVIDFGKLRLHPPRPTFDLPGGARRLLQKTEGFDLNIVSGQVTYRDCVPTGALPGRLAKPSGLATITPN